MAAFSRPQVLGRHDHGAIQRSRTARLQTRKGIDQLADIGCILDFDSWVSRHANDCSLISGSHYLPKKLRCRSLLKIEAMFDRKGSVEQKDQFKRQLILTIQPLDVLRLVVLEYLEIVAS